MRRWTSWMIVAIILGLGSYSSYTMNRIVAQGQSAEAKKMGTFYAAWVSNGITIEVRATQKGDEDEDQFAERCHRLVQKQLAKFPKD